MILGLFMIICGVVIIGIAGYALLFGGGWTGHDDDLSRCNYPYKQKIAFNLDLLSRLRR